MIRDPFAEYDPYKNLWYKLIMRRINRKSKIKRLFM